ncbi:MAG: DUF4349 domain-containing protein [Alphaproteobacteria bacterium]|nr:DUF4349 domain-containing protein [Alphaproteobacteria bacterium]
MNSATLRALLAALLLFAFIVLSGCAKRADLEAAGEYYDEDYPGYDYEETESTASRADYAYKEPRSSSRTRSSGGKGGAAQPSRYAEPMDADGVPDQDDRPPAEPAPVRRKVFYNGFVRLRVTDAEDTVAQVVEMVEARGGYVERRSLRSVTVRVPVDTFLDTYEAVQALGDVLDESLTAQDVTDAFTETELRLRVAEDTRARLQELLAQATEEQEKIALLREIQRLTEQIDQIEAELRTLSQLAAYSRLTVEAQPRQLTAGSDRPPPPGALAFLRRLSPFKRDVAANNKHLPLEVPEGFVALDLKRRFVAESADGAAVWAHKRENQPQGDAAFWVAAMSDAHASDFASAEIATFGAWQVLRLVEAGADEPYEYWVGFRVDGKWLHVVEVYLPSPAHAARYGDALRSILSAGET